MIELAPKTPFLDHDELTLAIFTCTHNNKYDWRLPTFDEYTQDREIFDFLNGDETKTFFGSRCNPVRDV